jgi:tetratricopeptide (TPR) repeat protein
MKQKLLILIFGLTSVSNIIAQNIKRPENYNYQRGVEAIQNEKPEEALEYFNKDVQENPKNGYSFSWIALLRENNQEFGKAITAADQAIKLLPKKDIEYVVFAYATRSDVYLQLGDTIKALSDLASAIKVNPESTSMYEKRAQIYYEQAKYELADTIRK